MNNRHTKTLQLILFLLQIEALWLLFSGQVDAQWFPWITLGQLLDLCLAVTLMRTQRKSTTVEKVQAAQPRQRRKLTFHPSEAISGIPAYVYQAPSPYEEQPQVMYPKENK